MRNVGLTDGRTNGQLDGRTNGQTNERANKRTVARTDCRAARSDETNQIELTYGRADGLAGGRNMKLVPLSPATGIAAHACMQVLADERRIHKAIQESSQMNADILVMVTVAS